MSENYDIDPGGSGDYTLAQTGLDDNDGSLSGRGVVQFTLFDNASDVGEINVNGANWSNESASDFVRVIAPLSQRHNGVKGCGGAWVSVDSFAGGIQVSLDYTELVGVRIAHNYYSGIPVASIDTSNVLLDSLMITMANNVSGQYAAIRVLANNGSTTTGNIVKNCIGYLDGKIFYGLEIAAMGGTSTALAYNNTIYDSSGCSFCYTEAGAKGYGTLTLTSENNFGYTDYYTGCFSVDMPNGALTQNNCGSTDGTADDFGGSNNLVDLDVDDCFASPGANLQPLRGGELHNAGTTVSAASPDAVGTNRPQSTAYDVGAIELKPDDFVSIT